MSHAKFLTRCLQLATYANGRTAPNPMVGAVIVHDGVIIGEGYHQKAGDPHAEVMAINSVEDKSL
ncbi:riboflavin biosynthesis protein RibD, partial [Schleiferiaceae bacterium]|nr:riboflavin biosynthesis protein RibD [Schleiferiaceae bacterium]